METTDIKISFLLCVYNGADTLNTCIESLLRQDFEDFEAVIIDDGSDDETWQILRSYQSNRIRIFKKVNTGLTKSLNFGLALCRGKFVARIDADDISHPDRLRLQYIAALENDYKFVASSYIMKSYIDGTQDEVVLSPDVNAHVQTLRTLGTPFHHSTMLFDRSYVLQHGGYDISFRTGQDFELWQRLVTPANTNIVSQPLVTVTINQSNSITGRRTIMANLSLHFRIFSRVWTGNPLLTCYYTITSVKPLRQLVKKWLN